MPKKKKGLADSHPAPRLENFAGLQCRHGPVCQKEVSVHTPGLCSCNESGREIKMTQDDKFI